VFNTDVSDAGQPDVYLIQPDGTGLRPLAATDAYEAGGIWSPDGSSMAISRTIDGAPTIYDGPSAVYLIDRDGTNLRQLTRDPLDLATGWSPDGSKLMFASAPLGRGGPVHTQVINADGAQHVTLLTNPEGGASWSRWACNRLC
jgi:Tol biopolymer transport system component